MGQIRNIQEVRRKRASRLRSMDTELAEYRESLRNSQPNHAAFQILRSGIFHHTSLDGFKEIQLSGFLSPNEGQFPFSYPQTEASFGLARRYVSLFDFETPTEEECISELMKWSGYFSGHRPVGILIRLDRERLHPKLIANEVAEVGTGCKYGWMPYIEAWYPESIPIAWFSGVTCLVVERHNLSVYHFIGTEGMKTFCEKLPELTTVAQLRLPLENIKKVLE